MNLPQHTKDTINKLKNLIIPNLESAKALAQFLDPSYLRRHMDQHSHSKKKCDHPPPHYFTQITSISLGPELSHSIYKASDLEYLHIHKILRTLKCILRPTHLCLTADPVHLRGNEEYFEDLNDNPQVMGLISRIYDMGRCCIDAVLKNVRIQLSNLPHLRTDHLRSENIEGAFMRWHDGDLSEYGLTLRDMGRGCKRAARWCERNLRVVNKEDAEPRLSCEGR
ncbi:hypothetical protein I302_100104 [Kwoniella bestiolae CBS 10118]|uniref:Uncharacterized protein n=1 Tax=Kwoniella bestiolae CBS 10118 TaxID=1296100 RepID=A0A1B9G444_9TREE|nr:hypothetical protein I302_03478 [Kwoniella bestiolae CBS 10118]OCF25805.1 hypothetical protein I302_03478 [Kwoniella bestiolae CBS 10118]